MKGSDLYTMSLDLTSMKMLYCSSGLAMRSVFILGAPSFILESCMVLLLPIEQMNAMLSSTILELANSIVQITAVRAEVR